MAMIDLVVYHHGGEFVTKDYDEMIYDIEEKLDVDTLDVFVMRDHYKALRYDKIVQCWWLVPGRPLNIGWRVLDTDNELLELCFYAERNGNGIPSPNYKDNSAKLINSKPTLPQSRSTTRKSPRTTAKVDYENHNSGEDGNNNNGSYDSVEDNLYVPGPDEMSSEDEDDTVVTQARMKYAKLKRAAGGDLKKSRDEIMLKEDGLVVDDSDEDVDLT
ncbi:hypothetical protein PIB30_032693 [Stylosanthes scabra]|uniref:PB1-like domain-containing protein n=1 Tax=Stylosanthes scabra TaxID=79078 RepID=A0ABU6QCE8_9FABA|nr:hypothetical protein [Stylosanthes scabra]